MIQSTLARLIQGKTLLVIAHRLSTVADADRIFVVEDGKIAAQGTQAELLEGCPLYRNMGKPTSVSKTMTGRWRKCCKR